MPGIYYAAVDGDPLTSGEGGQVYASGKVGTITDESGRPRRMVFIGDDAYCAKCKSTGSVTYGAGVNDRKRMVDLVNGGRLQAVGGDIVLCKCTNPPRIIAMYGTKWRIIDRGDADTISRQATPSPAVNHWISFTLTEPGNCEGLQCVAHFADGSQEAGVFDAKNKVRFERANNSTACSRIEFLFDGGSDISGSVTESLLAAMAE
ncbi:hypothetical protein OKW38_005182 [Paraburkholderia sp. MM5496-R1]|uniref:hypothetical protein n=1 Tax=Paraburkholderia sp. MM5496-R1 TaxID=2991065 RepID=UPI003D1DA35C